MLSDCVNWIHKRPELARVGVVALIGTVMSWVTYEIVYFFNPFEPRATTSWAVSFTIGVFRQHHLHRNLTFPQNGVPYGTSLGRDIVASLIVIVLSTILNFALTEIGKINYRAAWAVCLVSVAAVDYMLIKLFVFRRRRAQAPAKTRMSRPEDAPSRAVIDLTPIARLYATRRTRAIRSLDPEKAQRRVLRRLIAKAAGTRFGREHGFSQITSVEAYQKAVPPRDFKAFWEKWWRVPHPNLVDVTWPGHIPYFALTSGTTTGRSKYIPYTVEMRRDAVRGFVDLLCFHLDANPGSRLLGGSFLALTGPTELAAGEGAASGAVSAITAGAAPKILRRRLLPPIEIANLHDWREKIRRLAPVSLASDVRFLGGSPNWLLVYLEEVAKIRGGGAGKLVDWYPNLELIAHGGVNFAPYRERFQSLLEGGHAETRELYSASEGVFAYADRGDGEGLRLHLDGNVFFEFIPVESLGDDTPVRHWVGTIESGVDYALAITTAAGLWCYLLGDIVRFVSTRPPRIAVVGRLGQGLSVYGEHLIEAEVADALSAAAASVGRAVLDYTLGATEAGERSRHLLLVETDAPMAPPLVDAFATAFDAALCAENDDYAELRENDYALDRPLIFNVLPDGFASWMETHRRLGGQNKVPRIAKDPEMLAGMITFFRNRGFAGDEA